MEFVVGEDGKNKTKILKKFSEVQTDYRELKDGPKIIYRSFLDHIDKLTSIATLVPH